VKSDRPISSFTLPAFWKSARTAWKASRKCAIRKSRPSDFAYKEYVSEPAKQLLAELAAKDKERKAAAKQLAGKSLTKPEVVHD
jgi:hypothetical protein